jgi:branched-chain amino acid aminotransferase
MDKVRVVLNPNRKPKPTVDPLPFGQYFTDHMFLMNYEEGKGWFDPRIVPYGPFTLDPSCMVFHYAQEIFEGLKAYRRADGSIWLFRPEENFRRMNNSAKRMCIPEVDVDFCVDALKQLVELERDWVPTQEAASLYIRPFIIATDYAVGVHASKTYIFCIILSPSGNYYPEGLNPVKIAIEDEDVRAVRGGTGFTKCGGNYAGSIRASERAAERGYSQVLWLDGVHRKYIEEVGSMNIMFKIDGKVVTPMLQGSVLPGITRKSILEVCRDWGYEVEERLISVDEVIETAKDGRLQEMWGTGTAAVVSPVGQIEFEGESLKIGGGGIGQLTQKLYDELTGIQWGTRPDKRGWTQKVCD